MTSNIINFHGHENHTTMTPAELNAKQIKTKLTWKDLVVSPETRSQIHEIEAWVKNRKKLTEDLSLKRKLIHGYKALFYGPDTTGKTLTASLLGKSSGKEVYRIDLSQIVNKYIGETEKNLEALFAKAESADCILFFDEADALFGKRTDVKDSHDRYANQEVSFLLQRIEEYPGLAILTSNKKESIDPAFIRRLNAVVYFPKS
jgi:SpoVK/Ycf46/Vps4 family AAA+-type ATPase